MATKKKVFSVTKAVKANARERVGQPPPGQVLPDPKHKAAERPKHKPTLGQLLEEWQALNAAISASLGMDATGVDDRPPIRDETAN